MYLATCAEEFVKNWRGEIYTPPVQDKPWFYLRNHKKKMEFQNLAILKTGMNDVINKNHDSHGK
jgi:hypothetical protein